MPWAAVQNLLSATPLDQIPPQSEHDYPLQDFSFGLMIVGLKAFGFPITVPTFLLNWTMTYQPENTWRRDSSGLGIPLPSANHFMRQIIDGNGRPGPYLDKWIKGREGHPF
jgi:hypothetical protein